MKPTVLIIEPNTLFGTGLSSLLKENEFNAIFFNPEDFYKHQKSILNEYCPDVVIMEPRLENNLGTTLLKSIKSSAPNIHILILSGSEETDDIVKTLKLGAGGYLHKSTMLSELVNGINTIINKGFYVNEMVSGRLLIALRQNEPAVLFSKKELEFLQLCSKDLTYTEIGDKMGVSSRTIDNYRATLFEKLNIKSRTGLVVYSIKNNLIEL